MISPWFGLLGVPLALAAMVTLMPVAGRIIPIGPETSRKAVHVVMGLVCLGFPWLFHEAWPVIVLAGLAMALLVAIRSITWLRLRWGGVLGGVDRVSLGELYFPAAVAVVFVLADGRTLFFFIPVLVLTVADAVGALAGLRYGKAKYTTDDGAKSAEGSVVFFTTAFLATHIPVLLFTETGRLESLLIGLTVGLVVTLLEAISWKGIDNLLIPLGVFQLLEVYMGMEASLLGLRLLVLASLTVLVFIWRGRTTLNDSALLAAALGGFGLWALGGWTYLPGPLLLFLVYVLMPGFDPAHRPVQPMRAVGRIMVGAYLFLFIVLHADATKGWLGFQLCLACHTANIINARLRVVRSNWPPARILITAWMVPFILFAPILLTVSHLPPAPLVFLGASVLFSLLWFHATWSIHPAPTRLGYLQRLQAEALAAPVSASIIWLPWPITQGMT